MYKKRIQKEIEDMGENTNLNCSAGPIENNIMKWKGTIFGPADTPYAGGIFHLDIEFTEEYPFKPPIIHFTTKIYHCNINDRGSICLDILNKSWSPALTIYSILISICSLLAEPNPNDPLVPHIAEQLTKNKQLHDFTAREYTVKYA